MTANEIHVNYHCRVFESEDLGYRAEGNAVIRSPRGDITGVKTRFEAGGKSPDAAAAGLEGKIAGWAIKKGFSYDIVWETD